MKELFTKKQLREMGASSRRVPVILSLDKDKLTPQEAAKRLGVHQPIFLLESAQSSDTQENARYSYLGVRPEMILRIRNGQAYLKNGEEKEFAVDSPNKLITEILEERKSPDIPGVPPFTGGFAGSFSYDFYKYAEPTLNMHNADPQAFNDVDLMYFNTLYAFDHIDDKLYLISNIASDFSDDDYENTLSELKESLKLLESEEKEELFTKAELVSEGKDEKAYEEIVERTKEYIREGDIFQCVPSNRIRYTVPDGASLFPVYEILRDTNPSPYMYYLNFGDFEAAGSSPETLLRKSGQHLLTVPIAGTRPRGKTDEEDQTLEASLMDDPKELAEHNMLVDLARNDIGKIAKLGSVHVDDYMHIKRFRNVMHLCSNVSGTIRDELSCMDALSALLPAGTLSGAPKIRACEIIEELEDEKRGLYGGSAGYIGANGNMDMCIAIRTAFRKDNAVMIQSGGGVVYDSDPKTEYMETRHKLCAVQNALERAE